MGNSVQERIDIGRLKAHCRGQEVGLLRAFGFTDANLSGKAGPCPKCKGDNRACLIDKNDGAFNCRKCFSEKNGDFIAAIAWRNDWDLNHTLEQIAKHVGFGSGSGDIVERIAQRKHIPLESFKAYGAHETDRGNLKVCGVPMYGPDRQVCSRFDMSTISDKFMKGMTSKGKPTGLFVETDREKKVSVWPEAGETVVITEGVKDAAALHSLGFRVIGTNGSKLMAKFVALFKGIHVIIYPDADTTSIEGAKVSAGKLARVAASVGIATPPVPIKEKEGDGVREILAMQDGESLLRQAIQNAQEWKPGTNIDGERSSEPSWTSILTSEGRTERANSRRLLELFSDRIRFCFAWKKWLVWDAARWTVDDPAALRLAMSISDQVWMQAKPNLTKEILKFAIDSSKSSSISSILRLAAPDVEISVDDLDANPFLLNCPNGTVDLRTGEIRPHRREDSITKLCPTNFNPDAPSYYFDKFLESTFVDQTLIDFVQRLFGHCLTGSVAEQILPVFHGGGSNGKSTLLKVVRGTVGEDYCTAAPPSLLMEKKNEAHPTELAGLFRKRLVIAQETNHGSRLAESTVKQLTGGDRISARRMREDFWDFDPTHKLILCTNHKPQVKGTDHAIWRRLALVPFNVTFWNPAKGESGPPELQQDKTLDDKLAAEAEGVLAWMVRGCLEWQRIGLQIPDIVRVATTKYRSESDTVGRFIEQVCIVGNPDVFKVKFSSLYECLERFCGDSGENPPSRKFVGQYLSEKGFNDKHSGVLWYLGIAIRESGKAYGDSSTV